MSIEITVGKSQLDAIRLFVGEKSKKPSIQCIHFEVRQNETRMYATDEFAISIYRIECKQQETMHKPSMLYAIKASDFDGIKTKGNITIEIEDEYIFIQGSKVIIKYDSMTKETKTTLPLSCNIYKLFPRDISGESADYDQELIALYVKARKILFGNKSASWIRICQNGKKPALVTIGDKNFVGCIMPQVIVNPTTELPAWVLK